MIHEKKRTKEGRVRLSVQVKIRDQFSRTDQFQSRGNWGIFASIPVSPVFSLCICLFFLTSDLCDLLLLSRFVDILKIKKKRNKKFFFFCQFLSAWIKFWYIYIYGNREGKNSFEEFFGKISSWELSKKFYCKRNISRLDWWDFNFVMEFFFAFRTFPRIDKISLTFSQQCGKRRRATS